MEAIVLAGGRGTRLQSVVKDVPKPMADINGQPFLQYLLNFLSLSGISRVILSVGYKHEVITRYFGDHFNGMNVVYAVEQEPLGTGGALKKSLEHVTASDVFLLNGDTFFAIDLKDLLQSHREKGNDITLSLKPLTHFNRYGTVKTIDNKVVGFQEKRPQVEGLINGGVYVLKRDLLCEMELPSSFSFETEVLEGKLQYLEVGAIISDEYFIDIGVPEDYATAQHELGMHIRLEGGNN